MSDYNEKDQSSGTPQAQSPQETPSRPPNPDPSQHAAPRQQAPSYWSSRDAGRATQGQQQPGHGQNSYYGGGGYNNQQQYGGQYRPPYQQAPHQYSANNGWQNQNPQAEKYQWNFEDYDKLNSGAKKKKNKGLVVFAVSLLCVFTIILVGASGYTIYRSLVAEEGTQGGVVDEGSPARNDDRRDDDRDRDADSGPVAGSDASQMQIVGKPQVTEDTLTVDGRMSIPQVAESVSPSVVGVVTYMSNTFFEQAGSGSGIIMSEDGYIITNAHVVAGADAIKVVLHTEEPYEAILIGSDTRTDLAVLKIEETGLVAATFGDSDELRVGETVIAIGNPAGIELAGSVTQGIVSAVNRRIQTTGYSMSYIQTDAAINPGNSGGALVNEFAQVIGINSSKIVAEGYEGIGFAIPISEAKPIIDDLIQNGRVTGRVVLGITAQVVDEVMAKTYNVPMGLQIREVVPDSDIAAKGVQQGDIITHIDGERIYNFDDVRDILDQHKVGDVVQLTLYRQTSVIQGAPYDINVTLQEDQG